MTLLLTVPQLLRNSIKHTTIGFRKRRKSMIKLYSIVAVTLVVETIVNVQDQQRAFLKWH